MKPPLPRRSARRLVLFATPFLLALIVLYLRRDSGPRYEGRTVRGWFERLSHLEAAKRGVLENSETVEAKIALMELREAAVPFLVEEALTFRRDSFLRSNLHQLFLELPDWAGRGVFAPYAERNDRAVSLLRALRPDASVLRPLIEPYLAATNLLQRRQVLFMLGTVGQGAEWVAPLLLGGLTNSTDPWSTGIAAQSLRWLGSRASNALPTVLEILEREPEGTGTRMIDWLARLGPSAAPAVPHLEGMLPGTNLPRRISTALALVQIDPDHAAALELLRTIAQDDSTTARQMAGNLGPQAQFCWTVSSGPRRPHEGLARLIEPLARKEMEGWSPNGPGIMHATRALERVAPDRALALYRDGLARDLPGAVIIAGSLLRLERTNAAATKLLSDTALKPSGGVSWGAVSLWWLGEASSSNTVAVEALQELASEVTGPTTLDDAGNRNARWLRAQAADALARIRYREARLARGLPESEWELE